MGWGEIDVNGGGGGDIEKIQENNVVVVVIENTLVETKKDNWSNFSCPPSECKGAEERGNLTMRHQLPWGGGSLVEVSATPIRYFFSKKNT